MRCMNVEQEWLQFVPERCQCNVWCLQCDCTIHEVLGRRNCGRHSLFWCVEQSVGRSERIEDAGWQLLTSAHSMSEGTVEPCRAETRTAVLNVICRRTGSQWRSRKMGVICSDLLTPVTRRAAAFWMTCSLCSNWLLTPTSRLLYCCPVDCWQKHAPESLLHPASVTAW